MTCPVVCSDVCGRTRAQCFFSFTANEWEPPNWLNSLSSFSSHSSENPMWINDCELIFNRKMSDADRDTKIGMSRIVYNFMVLFHYCFLSSFLQSSNAKQHWTIQRPSFFLLFLEDRHLRMKSRAWQSNACLHFKAVTTNFAVNCPFLRTARNVGKWTLIGFFSLKFQWKGWCLAGLGF